MSDQSNARPPSAKGSTRASTAVDLQRAIGEVQRLIKADDPGAVNEIVGNWSLEELADLVIHLPIRSARTFLDWLPRKKAGRVLARMHPDHRASLSKASSERTLGELLREMPWDKAVDTLRSLPRRTRGRIAWKVAEAESTGDAGWYPEGTVGQVMERKFVAIPPAIPASEAIAKIRESFKAVGSVGTVFVVNDDNSLAGIFRPRDLLTVPPETMVSELMRTEFPVVRPETGQEVAAHRVEGAGFMSLPVVDSDGILVGQISPKLREFILAEERRREILGMSQVSPDSRATDGYRQIIRGRLPWLLAGLIGATVAAFVIGSFEDELEKAAILAAFIPVVMSMAGNSGLQAAGVSVQVLASGGTWPGDPLPVRLLRELAGALSNGAIAGIILACLVMLSSLFFEIENAPRLALATSLSLMTVTSVAALVGASVPFALNRMGIDPAAATGVFITTSNDVVGVLVYFTMADLFYF